MLNIFQGKVEYQGDYEGIQKYATHFQLGEETESDEKSSVNKETSKEDVDAPLDVPTSNDVENQEEPKETEELVDKGNIKNSLYWKYFQANGSYFLLIFVAILYVITQIITSGGDRWLAFW